MNGWKVIEEKHFQDKLDHKFYNEYVLKSDDIDNTITIIICDYYNKSRIYIDIIYLNKNITSKICIGSSKIKNIKNTKIVKYVDMFFELYLEDIKQYFNDKIFRNIIDVLHN